MRYRVKFADRPKVDPCVPLKALKAGQVCIEQSSGQICTVRVPYGAEHEAVAVIVGFNDAYLFNCRYLPIDLSAVKIIPHPGGGYTVDGWEEMVKAKEANRATTFGAMRVGDVFTYADVSRDSSVPYMKTGPARRREFLVGFELEEFRKDVQVRPLSPGDVIEIVEDSNV